MNLDGNQSYERRKATARLSNAWGFESLTQVMRFSSDLFSIPARILLETYRIGVVIHLSQGLEGV